MEIYLPDADDLSQLLEDEMGSYTEVVAYYKDGKNIDKLTKGDQTTPKRITYLYKKRTAPTAIEQEYKAIKVKEI